MLHRRDFIRMSGGAAIALAFAPCYRLFANDRDSKYALQLQLLAALKKFAVSHFLLNTDDDFFTKWSELEKMRLFLYVSRADRIESPEGFGMYKGFDMDEETALQEKKKYDALGYHTLLYRTAGTSSALITERLFSYPPECICFIVFHESFHVHLAQSGCHVNYMLEEATGDVIGNYGALAFSENNGLVNRKDAQNQITLNEHLYHFINKTVEKINKAQPHDFPHIYAGCNARISSLLKYGTAFQQDRFGYEVNNAYLLRNRYYAENYFIIRSLFIKMQSMAKFVRFMTDLPPEIEQAKRLIISLNSPR